MSLERAKLRWNGWGPLNAPDPLAEKGEAAWGWLGGLLGRESLPETPPVALDQTRVPPGRLAPALIDELGAIVGRAHVATDDPSRAVNARGQSYHDLLWLRSGALDVAPDVVLAPANAEEVGRILTLAARLGLAIVPRGGGTSVVGGVTARAGADHLGVAVLDLTRLCRVHEISEDDRLARVDAGIDGPGLESALQRRGYTLGHFPQSFEFSTLGGWIAHAGAGQQCARYGRPRDWLASARVATPGGLWETERAPASAAGPRLGDLLVGSEGALGVITDASVRLAPKPETRRFGAFLFKSFAEGVAAHRAIIQAGVPVATLRLSDAAETAFYQAFGAVGAPPPGLTRRLAMAYARRRGYLDQPASLIIMTDGALAEAEDHMAQAQRLARGSGGLSLGAGPGERWYHGRFHGPYLRDPLMNRGVGVDTLETATRWSELIPLHQAVHDALNEALGGRGVVFGHVSHAYVDGASLYFTYLFARDPTDPVAQWRRVKARASEAIIAMGGTISHHHGVGEDHRPWIAAEKGAAGITLLRAAKTGLDPASILNPGKLLPDD